jgi:hypothetical protein
MKSEQQSSYQFNQSRMSEICAPSDVFYEISKYLTVSEIKNLKIVCRNARVGGNIRIYQLRDQVFQNFQINYQELIILFERLGPNCAVIAQYATTNKKAVLFYKLCLDTQIKTMISGSLFDATLDQQLTVKKPVLAQTPAKLIEVIDLTLE